MSDFDGELNKSLDDFMESYKITDTEKIYSNGMELVPIFRIKQWEEYNRRNKKIEKIEVKSNFTHNQQRIVRKINEIIDYLEENK